MTTLLIRRAATESLLVAELAAHLRIDHHDEDGLLASLIAIARDHLERETGLSLLEQGFRLYLDRMPLYGRLPLLRHPVLSLDRITAFDAEGRPQALPLDSLRLLPGRPARLRAMRVFAEDLPVEIEFSAGYGKTADSVPPALKRAMLLHAGAMHGFRGAVPLEEQPAAVPAGYERLIAPFMLRRV